MVTHAFNLSTLEVEEGESLKLEASLVYRASSRSARATERNTVVKGERKESTEVMLCFYSVQSCSITWKTSKLQKASWMTHVLCSVFCITDIILCDHLLCWGL